MGWDNHYYDEPDYDPYDREGEALSWAAEDAFECASEAGATDEEAEEFSAYRVKQKGITTEHAWRNWIEMKECKLT